MEAEHIKVEINSGYSAHNMWRIYDSSGMLDYNKLVSELCVNEGRNNLIVDNIVKLANEGRKQIVLSLRVEHCEHLVELLQKRGVKALLCVGKITAKKREQILKQQVEWDVIVATYSLLKEGVSIKELDTLHLCSPAKEKGLIVQCAGRIERYLDGKKQPLIYDYVDIDIPYCENAYK
jgi:superfamily II DNA or RNA helicase